MARRERAGAAQHEQDRREHRRARWPQRLDEDAADRAERNADAAEPRHPRDGDLAFVDDTFCILAHRRSTI